MGEVAATYSLMPSEVESPIEKIKDTIPQVIPEEVTVRNMDIKPLAFGLKIVEVTFLMEDREGIIDRLEEALQSIEGIKNIDTVSMTLV